MLLKKTSGNVGHSHLILTAREREEGDLETFSWTSWRFLNSLLPLFAVGPLSDTASRHGLRTIALKAGAK